MSTYILDRIPIVQRKKAIAYANAPQYRTRTYSSIHFQRYLFRFHQITKSFKMGKSVIFLASCYALELNLLHNMNLDLIYKNKRHEIFFFGKTLFIFKCILLFCITRVIFINKINLVNQFYSILFCFLWRKIF